MFAVFEYRFRLLYMFVCNMSVLHYWYYWA